MTRISRVRRVMSASLATAALSLSLVTLTSAPAFSATHLYSFDQCANSPSGLGYNSQCSWTNGALNRNNSLYAESDVVPERLVLVDFNPGSVHTLSFSWSSTKGGVHAIDFLADYNWSEAWISNANACNAIAGCASSSLHAFAVPHDPRVPAAYENAVASRHVIARGATITAMSTPTLSGSMSGDSDTSSTITFRVDASGSMCNTNAGSLKCDVAIFIGGHVATRLDWGTGLGAGTLTGAALHVTLGQLDGDSLGSRSNNVQSSALAPPHPGLVMTKSADVTNFSSAGTVITYRYSVRNTGDVPLTLQLVDPLPGLSSIDCPGQLAPGATVLCSASYVTTQDDLDRGSVVNTATATGRTPDGSSLRSSSTVTVPAVRHGSLGLMKTASPTTFTSAGDLVNYSYVVTNLGNVTLNTVFVNDPKSGLSAVSCPTTTLAVNASMTCSATYHATAADVTAGVITNTATAAARTPSATAVTSPPATAVVTLKEQPAITLTKTVTPTTYSAPGQSLTYHFLVTNTGNVALHAVTVLDTNFPLGAVSCPATTLAVSVSMTCSASHVVTQGDLDAGSINNTARAAGTSPLGDVTVSSPSSATATAIVAASISLAKTADRESVTAAGQLINYRFTVTNTGNVTLHNIVVTDALVGLTSVNCPTGPLAPGNTLTCAATYVVKASDIQQGAVVNSATVSADTPANGVVSDGPASVTVPVVTHAELSLVKLGSPEYFAVAGTTIKYTFLATNAGNQDLTSLVIHDLLLGSNPITCAASTLAVGESTTCTGYYQTTQSDLDRGVVHNFATATASDPLSHTVTSNEASAVVQAEQQPSLSLVKSASPTTFAAPGVTITYSYVVTNTGNVTVHSVGIRDLMSGLVFGSCGATTLAPGASTTCTATYVTTQADLDAGSITNTANATGIAYVPTPVSPISVVSPNASAVVTATGHPSISVVKSASPVLYDHAGQVLTFGFLVTNTGTVTATSFSINDALNGLSAISCPVSVLAPGASATCSATYTTTQQDMDRGHVTNTATAQMTSGAGSATSAPSTVVVPARQLAAIELVKSASVSSFSAAGQVIDYTFDVTNTGNVSVTGISIQDAFLSSAISCPPILLAPGQDIQCTSTYVTNQTDVDTGSITNIASAWAVSPLGALHSQESSVTIPSVATSSIALTKSATPDVVSSAGQAVTYHFIATNTGQTTLLSLQISDPLPGLSAPACDKTVLLPGDVANCVATYNVTQADIDAGLITNTAFATAVTPNGLGIASPNATAQVDVTQRAAISATKSVQPTTYTHAGETLVFAVTATNTGNLTLHSVVIADQLAGAQTPVCPTTTVNPGASVTCLVGYVVTQADLDRGWVTNTATASGTTPADVVVTSDPASVTATAVPEPALTLQKSATPTFVVGAGDVVHYSYLVTNSGNQTLSDVAISDAMVGLSTPFCPNVTLAPGDDVTCTATYAVTQSDIDAGSVTNTATASAHGPGGSVTSAPSSVTVGVTRTPALGITKSSLESTYDHVGQVIHYEMLVTNTGNVTVHDLVISDILIESTPVSCPASVLAPGDSVTCSAQHTVTQADLDQGSLTNEASATALSPTNSTVASPPSTVTIPATSLPSIALFKSAYETSFTSANQVIHYAFTVKNTGNVTLFDLQINDSLAGQGLSGVTCPSTQLEPTMTEICGARYVTTLSDVLAGVVHNVATAQANPPFGQRVISSPSSHDVPLRSVPSISLVTATTTKYFSAAGTRVEYTFDVGNSGNVTLSSLFVTADLEGLSAITCPVANLSVGQQMVCTASYFTTSTDLSAGQVVLSAVAHGQSPLNEPVHSDPSGVVVPKLGGPSPVVG